MAPTGQGGQWQEVLCCSVCNQHFNETYLPVSLICGHVICRVCAEKADAHAKPCPVDDWKCTMPPSQYPNNVALLSIVSPQNQCMTFSGAKTSDERRADQLLCQIAKFFREAESERGGTVTSRDLSRTLQRKVLALLCYQWIEPDGRSKFLKMCRGISERVMIEIILSIQSNIHVSSQLWSAVRARGCQFLGPAMQDDVLRLILITLETGECIARKNLVMYVVQTLEADYPQVSKTCVGHVVQLLYRASCFNVLKRDGESSLMQLKEEFRTYEALRREHDSQIVQIAFESGLRIGPDQWSALLYADQNHRSHMQSIIDKLQSRSTYLQGIQELRALSTSPESMIVPVYRQFLSQVVPCLEFFAKVEPEDEATMVLVADGLAQIRNLLRLHCSQDDLRRLPREDRRMMVPFARPFYHLNQNSVEQPPNPAVVDRDRDQVRDRENSVGRDPPKPAQNLNSTNPGDSGNETMPPNVSQPPPFAPPPQQPPQQQPRRKRYQMGIPPQRQEFMAPYPGPNPNFYRQMPPHLMAQPINPPPMAQMNPHLNRMNRRGRRDGPSLSQQPPCGPPIPMLIGLQPQPPPPPHSFPMMPAGTADVVTSDGKGNERSQRVVIMQSPTHMPGGPVVMIPQQSMGRSSTVTPVPMGAMTPQSVPVQVPPNAIWAAASPTANIIYPANSPPGQPSHTIWIHPESNLFPTFDYSAGGMIWGPTTMLRESGADAEQLLAKRCEILKRLQPSEDDDDPEDGGIGHVSYTVASSVLDDRMDHHPITMIPVASMEMPTMPLAYPNMPNEETVTMIGEIVQQGRPRAPSLTQTTPILVTANSTTAVVPQAAQSECAATVAVAQPTAIPLVPLQVPVVPAENFNPAVPPPQPGQPMLVDSATGLLTPIRPILVTYPQNVVSNSLDIIVDVKERLSEANGYASEAENAHLQMELRMAESEMAHLDPFIKNNCLIRELQQVDRELQQLQIEPARQ